MSPQRRKEFLAIVKLDFITEDKLEMNMMIIADRHNE